MKFIAMIAAVAALNLEKKDSDWSWDPEPTYRVDPPAHFSGDDKDIFMHSMYKNYASDQLRPTGAVLEDGTHEVAATGKHVISEADAKHLANEVVETHLGLTGDEKTKYIDEHFDKAYGHYDVNGEKEIEVGMAPQFTRMLLDDPHANIYSQVTKAKK